MPATLLLHLAPYVAMAVMSLGLWGLWQEHKGDQLKHANDQATIQQNLKDRAESAKQIGILQTKLEDVDAKAQPIIQRIVQAPVTTGCGPVVNDSVAGVRDLYNASAQPARPKPDKPAGMPTPLDPRGKADR